MNPDAKRRQFYSPVLSAILVFSLSLSRLSGQTCSPTGATFSDSTFNNSDWEFMVFPFNNGGTASANQLSTNGNPAPSRSIDITVNALTTPSSTDYPTVLTFSGKTNAIWNPATMGPIVSVDTCQDALTLAPNPPNATALQATSVAVKQNGKVYIASPGLLFTSNQPGGWTQVSHSGFKASDFTLVGTTSIFSSGSPDFSSTGAPIEFGFYRGDSTGGGGYTTHGVIDNWSVSVHGATGLFINGVQQCCGVIQVTPRGGAGVYGPNLADHTGFGAGNVKVLVNGVSAPIRYQQKNYDATQDRVDFTIPAETPVGPATFQVFNNGAASQVFTITIAQYAPVAFGSFHLNGVALDATSPASPGEKIIIGVSGLGPSDSPPVQASLGGFPVTIESLKDNVPIYSFLGLWSMVFAVPPQLGTGNHLLLVTIGGVTSNLNLLPVASTGLSLSQTGVTFRAVAGSTSPLQRSVAVIGNSMPVNWTATAATVSGGNWLQVTPAQGISDPAQAAPSITISANPSKLAAGSFYGTVTIRAATALQVISVVMNVLTPDLSPGVLVEPTGLTFTGTPGSVPAAKSVQISNPTTAPLTFTTSQVLAGAIGFQVQPVSGTVAPGQPASISIQPLPGLGPGIFGGPITLSFSDGKTRTVNVLAVFAAGASSASASPADGLSRSAACVPTRLLPVFTLLGVNFSSPVAWPADIETSVVDDCGTQVNSGSVVVSFSNGDPPLGLTALQNGRWSVTWTPNGPVNSNLVVRLDAQTYTPALKGTTSVSGAAPANPGVPIVGVGGIVGTASYVSSPAPGTLISIFGSQLAGDLLSATALPLPQQLLSTQVILGGDNIPLVFVSPNQINAQVPYKLPSKATYPVIVLRGTAISTPQSVAINDGQPAVFTLDQSGGGQGHIYKITSAGAQVLAAPGAPATAGDVVTIYCSGLGEVTPATVIAGSPAPLDVLENTVNKVTATIGGVVTPVLFAGLTPGFVGLYQVNLTIPANVPPSETTPLVLTVGGQASKPVTMALK